MKLIGSAHIPTFFVFADDRIDANTAAAGEWGIIWPVQRETDMANPGVAIDGKVVSTGKIPTVAEIRSWLPG